MDKKTTQNNRLRAFTVHPGWAWALLAGVKKQEWRTFLPNPREGECAIHVSKSYSRSQWQYEVGRVKEMWRRNLPSYEELCENWCGKVVAVCHYKACEDDWEEDAYGWHISKVRKLSKPFATKGALKLWKMSPEVTMKTLASL